MAIQDEITRIANAKTAIANAITAKGGTVSGTIDTFASAINTLNTSSGGGINKSVIITTWPPVFYSELHDINGSYAVPIIICSKVHDTDTNNNILSMEYVDFNTVYNYTYSIIDVFDKSIGFEGFIGIEFNNTYKLNIVELLQDTDNNNLYYSYNAITQYVNDTIVGFSPYGTNQTFKAEPNKIYIFSIEKSKEVY